ncbi:hypothetical protein Kpol_1023p71 [Vanderwaltozyma polyspora DSM 70294]|uniref:DNA repair and recombination protein RAD52 n=1 Tax=Vanderwaltozyma polyspora (strain ATCC 22028 / DSM 70294 / BCRC 21397 / CBS 2163 / NBRC 10782 / NRRL Y-8283 / UCD 57-17) TaxID=436907 RepID=A7TFU4_VANPO|nr:uncharacterized protein Kpol_1023p71 [Vanderwaltozyma polyspora DSM 70294]EDO18902.1 hypothetical protein Kpol_1023p71 [Vanderwaltozyma polyspora DSM 70294]
MMEEKKPFVALSEDIQAKLDKKLGPEYISKRVGFGSSRVAYIEGWKAINLANQIFGYNGWSTEVKSVVIDFLDERQNRFSIGCTAIVRVTLSNGTYREDIGYGTVENERRKAAAFERAKKSAVTDALKRSLRGFGNALGNCLYDKDFLSKIDKVKFDPPDFDEGNLFRPSDEISEISRSNTIDNNEIGHPSKRRQLTKAGNLPVNKIKLEEKPNQNNYKMITPNTNTVAPQDGTSKFDNTNKITTTNETVNVNVDITNAVTSITNKDRDEELLDDSLMFSDDLQDDDLINIGNTEESVRKTGQPIVEAIDTITDFAKPVPHQVAPMAANNNHAALPNLTRPPLNPSNNINHEPVTFVTAKAANTLQSKSLVTKENVFDPKYQAQSIKHTIDQTTSKHIPASILKEKGVTPARNSVYEKFAPKGKQLSNNANINNETTNHESETSNVQQGMANNVLSKDTTANSNLANSGNAPQMTAKTSLNSDSLNQSLLSSSVSPAPTTPNPMNNLANAGENNQAPLGAFAPASSASTSTTASATPSISSTDSSNIQPSSMTANTAPKFAPSRPVVHPNTFIPTPTVPKPGRREVGRPKINPFQIRKPST